MKLRAMPQYEPGNESQHGTQSTSKKENRKSASGAVFSVKKKKNLAYFIMSGKMLFSLSSQMEFANIS